MEPAEKAAGEGEAKGENEMTRKQAAVIVVAVGMAAMLAAMFLAIAVARADAPQPGILEDRCDVVMIHHKFDPDSGDLVFDQLIFLNLARDGVYDVLAWRLLRVPAQWPVRKGDRWEILWHDGDHLRRVNCGHVEERWGFDDPEEHAAITRLPKDWRRGLWTRRTTHQNKMAERCLKMSH